MMTDGEKLVELLREIGMLEIEDCEYTAERLIANGVMVQEWISVEDRLPKKWEYVLAINEYDEGAREPCIAHIIDRGWMADGVIGCKITHWMPMPEPPKEE